VQFMEKIGVMKFIKQFFKEILIAGVLAILAAIVYESYKEWDRVEGQRNNSRAVATIFAASEEGGGNSGSGFFISQNGTLVTNYHVIENAIEKKGLILAKIPSGAFYELKEIVGIDKDHDVAKLKFDANEVPYVKIGNSQKITIGEKIYAIGILLPFKTPGLLREYSGG